MLLSMQKLTAEITEEVRAMASHALSAGKPVPGWVLETAAQAEGGAGAAAEVSTPDLQKAHAELSRLVAPFTPDLIILLEMEAEASGFERALGQVRIARVFMAILGASLALFLALSVSPYLNDPKYGDIFTSSGWPLFANELFFLATAAVGASFSNLFQLNRELTRGTFTPKNQSSYWVQFTLGVVAGLLLSTLLNVNTIAPTDDVGSTQLHLRAAALALVGGFSSSVVQRVIQRLIDALESILRGSPEQDIEAREQAGRQQLEEMLAKDRTRAALLLVDVQRRLAAGESPEALDALLDRASQAILLNEPHRMEDPARPATPALPSPRRASEVEGEGEEGGDPGGQRG